MLKKFKNITFKNGIYVGDKETLELILPLIDPDNQYVIIEGCKEGFCFDEAIYAKMNDCDKFIVVIEDMRHFYGLVRKEYSKFHFDFVICSKQLELNVKPLKYRYLLHSLDQNLHEIHYILEMVFATNDILQYTNNTAISYATDEGAWLVEL